MHSAFMNLFKDSQCMICFQKIVTNDDLYNFSCCNQSSVHTLCIERYLSERKRHYFKYKNTLDGFSFNCIFCNTDVSASFDTTTIDCNEFCTFLSTPSTLVTSGIESDNTQTQSISLSVGEILCSFCYEPFADDEEGVYSVCCNVRFHKQCSDKITDCIRQEKLNNVFKGFSCLYCTVDKYEISEALDLIANYYDCSYKQDTSSKLVFYDVNPLACMLQPSYLITALILHALNVKINSTVSPWRIDGYKSVSDNVQNVIELLQSKLFFDSKCCEDILKNRKDIQQGSLSNDNRVTFSNMYIPAVQLNELITRFPDIQKALFDLSKELHTLTSTKYPEIYNQMDILHSKKVIKIVNIIQQVIMFILFLVYSKLILFVFTEYVMFTFLFQKTHKHMYSLY